MHIASNCNEWLTPSFVYIDTIQTSGHSGTLDVRKRSERPFPGSRRWHAFTGRINWRGVIDIGVDLGEYKMSG